MMRAAPLLLYESTVLSFQKYAAESMQQSTIRPHADLFVNIFTIGLVACR